MGASLCYTGGSSRVIDPYGTIVSTDSTVYDGLITGEIDIESIGPLRSKFKVLQDRRPDLYII